MNSWSENFIFEINLFSKIPLLDRRGGSRPSKASVWRRGGGLIHNFIPPPRLARFTSSIGLGTPPVQEGINDKFNFLSIN